MPIIAPISNATFFERAKRDIDLPGFLAEHGWESVAGHDGRFSRSLRGPDGSHIVVSHASDGHWVWFRDGEGHGGSIVDAVQQLLGVTAMGGVMGVLRRALASLPPPLPVATGSGRRAKFVTAESTQAHTTVGSLHELGQAYLVERRHLNPSTVQRFAHDLRENERGNVRACHNADDDGEERGPGWKSFVGGQHLGTGRGRSIWRSRPSGLMIPRILLVAESFVDAISAWEALEDDSSQHASILASTAGSISSAGIIKLEKLVAWLRGKALGREVWLYDASDNGEAGTEQRLAILRDLANRTRASYLRLPPPDGLKDWNDYLVRTKVLSPPTGAQAYALVTDVANSCLAVDPEPNVSERIAPKNTHIGDSCPRPAGHRKNR